MIKVMAFGTFDILHPGHKHFLEEAKRQGNYLVVVVARDLTVRQLKKQEPLNNEKLRAANLAALGIADKVILGNLEDKHKIIEQERPDVICLGYDQSFFASGLQAELEKRGLKPRIVRLSPYMEGIYKSSLLRQSRKA